MNGDKIEQQLQAEQIRRKRESVTQEETDGINEDLEDHENRISRLEQLIAKLHPKEWQELIERGC